MYRFLLFFLLAPSLLPAATFTVTSSADTSDPGTLRWAMEQHASQGGDNTIVFDPALAEATISVTSTLPQVTFDTLEINGANAPGLTLDRGGAGGRVFLIGNQADAFILRNLTVQNSEGLFGGGCIRATGSGDTVVTIRDVTFRNCEQRPSGTNNAFGGAIYTEFNADGRLDIRGSRFIGNRVYGNDNLVFGGALYAEGGTVILLGNRFELNSAEDLGGAFHQGGAIYVRDAEVGMNENEFLFNQAADGDGGAVVLNLRPENGADVLRNLFAANVGNAGSALFLATQSIGSDEPFFNVWNNTFLSNTSTDQFGGALYLREGRIVLRNNSFIDNSNSTIGAAHLGYVAARSDFLAVWNNLLTPAAADACKVADGGPPDDFGSAGYNLLPDTSCEINGFNDLIGDAGRFLALGDYGGDVRTVPPATGNLALDRGNPSPITTNSATCTFTDAREVDRPGDGDGNGTAICDIGAFEWTSEAAIFLDGFEQAGLVIP